MFVKRVRIFYGNCQSESRHRISNMPKLPKFNKASGCASYKVLAQYLCMAIIWFEDLSNLLFHVEEAESWRGRDGRDGCVYTVEFSIMESHPSEVDNLVDDFKIGHANILD